MPPSYGDGGAPDRLGRKLDEQPVRVEVERLEAEESAARRLALGNHRAGEPLWSHAKRLTEPHREP